jgi:hypothetical protein
MKNAYLSNNNSEILILILYGIETHLLRFSLLKKNFEITGCHFDFLNFVLLICSLNAGQRESRDEI